MEDIDKSKEDAKKLSRRYLISGILFLTQGAFFIYAADHFDYPDITNMWGFITVYVGGYGIYYSQKVKYESNTAIGDAL